MVIVVFYFNIQLWDMLFLASAKTKSKSKIYPWASCLNKKIPKLV